MNVLKDFQIRPWQESRSREILEEKLLLVFPLELEKWIFMSRSPLDFQDLEKTFLFLLSVHKIFVLNFSFSSRFSRFYRTISLSPLDFQNFAEQFLFLPLIFKIKKIIFSFWYPRFWSLFLIKIRSEVSSPHLCFPPKRNILDEKWNPLAKTNGRRWLFGGLEPSKITLWASSWWPSSQARVTSAKSESLSSIKFPNALLMLSWKSFHWRLVKEEQTISLFSFYSRNKRKEFQYSLSLLEIVEI